METIEGPKKRQSIEVLRKLKQLNNEVTHSSEALEIAETLARMPQEWREPILPKETSMFQIFIWRFSGIKDE